MTNQALLHLKSAMIPEQLRPTYSFIVQLIIDGNGKADQLDVEKAPHYLNLKSMFVVKDGYWSVDWFIHGKSKGFHPPSLIEVTTYMNEIGHAAEASKFIDFYASKGWMVGKNKMKDWKASCRNWVRGIETKTKPSNDKLTTKISRSEQQQLAASFKIG